MTNRTAYRAEPIVGLYRELEWEGVTYVKGDPIQFRNDSNEYRFEYWEDGKENGPIVTVFWVNHHYRSLYCKNIKTLRGKRKAEVVCVEHPTYGAVRKPRTDCARCWSAYNTRKEGSSGSV